MSNAFGISVVVLIVTHRVITDRGNICASVVQVRQYTNDLVDVSKI